MFKKFTSVFLSSLLTFQSCINIHNVCADGDVTKSKVTAIRSNIFQTGDSKFKNYAKILSFTVPPIALLIIGGCLLGAYASKKSAEQKTSSETTEEKVRLSYEILQKLLLEETSRLSDMVLNLCEEVQPIIEKDPSLVEISGPTIVVGDVHGNFGAVDFCCKRFLEEVGSGKRTNIVFLGDYVDRGDHAPGGPSSIKNVAMLFWLKKTFPDKVFLLRGNHEVRSINCEFGFRNECASAYGADYSVYLKVNSVFDRLSLAAVIDNKTFCVHGGIGSGISLDIIKNIQRPLKQLNQIAGFLLWSDPFDEKNPDSFRVLPRGAGCLYGQHDVHKFLENNNLTRIVRAHQCAEDGHADKFGDGTVITLFSAPDYRAVGSNTGAIMKIDGDNIMYEKIEYSFFVKLLALLDDKNQ